jgi:hypothetical protein
MKIRNLILTTAMKEFKGTKGNWQIIYNYYKKEPKKVCTGVGIVDKINNGEYTEFVCNSLLPETDKEYLKQHEQIEADMKLIASAPKMLAALIKISEGKGRYNENKLIHASNTIEDIIQLAKEAINEAIS